MIDFSLRLVLVKDKDSVFRYNQNDLFFLSVHLMSPTGIVAKLRRDYNYSITRLCTDPPDFRFVIITI